MRLLTFFASLCDDSAEADMVSHKLLGMPTIVTVSPVSLAVGGVEVTDRSSGERSVRPIEDVEANLRGAA
jgi:hypothetical protein